MKSVKNPVIKTMLEKASVDELKRHVLSGNPEIANGAKELLETKAEPEVVAEPVVVEEAEPEVAPEEPVVASEEVVAEPEPKPAPKRKRSTAASKKA